LKGTQPGLPPGAATAEVWPLAPSNHLVEAVRPPVFTPSEESVYE
jgi:hypothetical protein